MATAASPRSLVSLAVPDRSFYIGMAIAMLFTALVGFSRTYFLGLISGHARTITGRVPNATVHLHALLFMSWLVLFIVQTSLVATHRVKVHRKLGYFGGGSGGVNDRGGRPHRGRSGPTWRGPSGRQPVELHGDPSRRHHDLRHFLPRRCALAQQQGQAQATDNPGLRLPDACGAGTLAGRPDPWTAVLLRVRAAVPHRRRGVRPAVTRARPPSVLVGASDNHAGRRGACRPARQPRLGARHAVAVRLACTFPLP